LPTNPRQTTRECAYFRSRDKDGGHTIRSDIAENPVLHADIATSIELDWIHCRLTFYITGIGKFALFAVVALTLTRWRSLYNLTRIPWRFSSRPNIKISTWRISNVIVLHTYIHADSQTYRHTDRQTDRRHRNYCHAALLVVINHMRVNVINLLIS